MFSLCNWKRQKRWSINYFINLIYVRRKGRIALHCVGNKRFRWPVIVVVSPIDTELHGKIIHCQRHLLPIFLQNYTIGHWFFSFETAPQVVNFVKLLIYGQRKSITEDSLWPLGDQQDVSTFFLNAWNEKKNENTVQFSQRKKSCRKSTQILPNIYQKQNSLHWRI